MKLRLPVVAGALLFSAGAGSAATPPEQAMLICTCGDALDLVSLEVKKGTVDLFVGYPSTKSETFATSLKSGAFAKMLKQGRVEVTGTTRRSTTSFGETTDAVLFDATATASGKRGDYNGKLAMRGSVYDLSCSTHPP